MEKYSLHEIDPRIREMVIYFFWGVLTVIVNTLIFLGASYFFSIITANIIAFIIAVSFAYVTNGKYVFCEELTLNAFLKFVIMRLLTLVIDTGGLYILIYFGMDKLFSKVITNIVVVVLNYLFSKLFIFKK